MPRIPCGVPSRARTEVRCGECGLAVLVSKTSWQQTSVQWPEQGKNTCHELRSADQERSADALLRGCVALRRSIDKAALGGAIPIPD